MLKIFQREIDDVTILDLSGRITLGEGSPALRDTVKHLLGVGRKKIVLNLNNVNYIDSSGLHALASTFVATRNQGGDVRLLNLTKKVHDLLQVTKLYTVFDVFDSEIAVIASFGSMMCRALCPVCGSLFALGFPNVGLFWATCSICHTSLELQRGSELEDNAVVFELRIETYPGEYVQIVSASPVQLNIVGRLDLFSSYGLNKAWKCIQRPRRVLFNLQRTTEVDEAGQGALFVLLRNTERDSTAVISLEGSPPDVQSRFSTEPPVYSQLSAAVQTFGHLNLPFRWAIPITSSPPIGSGTK